MSDKAVETGEQGLRKSPRKANCKNDDGKKYSDFFIVYLPKQRFKFSPQTCRKKTYQWTKECIERLIELVEQYPVMYNTSLKDYKNQVIQAQARASIATNFEDCSMVLIYSRYVVTYSITFLIGPGDVRVKWKYLKEQFTRERRICNEVVPSGSGIDDSKKLNRKPWLFYNHMTFLIKHQKDRQYIASFKHFLKLELW